MVKSANTVKNTKSATAPKVPASESVTSGNTEPALLELFVSELKDIYWAENQLVKSLPKMQQSATSAKLADAIATHWAQTKNHVTRIEQIFDLLGKKAQAKKCDAMEGLTKEGEGVIEDTQAGSATRDAGIIIASQKVEHYEIAVYGGLAQLARTMGLAEVAGILEQTLSEEKEADLLLTDIAEHDINYQATTEA